MEWTAERIAVLRRLRDDGVSYAAIAARLGITRGAVSGKVDRLGLAAREPAPRGPRPPRAVLRRRAAPKPVDAVLVVPGGPAEPAHATHAVSRPGGLQGACDAPVPEGTAVGDCPCRTPPAGEAGQLPVDPPAAAAHGCSLLELTEDTCRWPVGDVGEPGFFFCGQPPLQGAPYCGPHCRIAFRPLDARLQFEFVPDRDAARVYQPETRFGQFADWDVT